MSFPVVSREYRPELNGLRAVAVLLVLLYHLDFEWMKGGFLGVDVFLVISGYFISRNIIYSLQEGKFTFYGFYTKRLRRLFPALIVTLLLVLIVGFFILTPANFERLGKSTIFSSLSFSNFFFWSEAGYFNTGSDTKPLLHMWSLSLEEQFYLFWPLLLFILYRFLKKYTIFFIILFILISLSLCEFYFSSQPEAVFFLIPFRMFEFLLGASCIWLEKISNKTPKILLELLLMLGLVLIGYSAVAYSATSQMPGMLSLIPCVGSMLVIYAGKAKFISWSLKNKPVELIGKASYSIYLIHWPLVVYYLYFTLDNLTLNTQIILGMISIALGFLMWHFVENTFRYSKDKNAKLDRVWAAIPASLLLLVFLSANVWGSSGFPKRFSGELYMTKEEILSNRERYFEDYRSNKELLLGNPEKGHIMIMGNSHSIGLIHMLRQNGFESKITSLKSLGECFNFGQSFNFEKNADLCSKLREQNLKDKNWATVDAIFLHDNWPNLDLNGFREILKRIRTLSNAPIYVVGPKMTYKKHIPEIIRASNSISSTIINGYSINFQWRDLKIRINRSLLKEFSHPYYEKNNMYYVNLLELQGGSNMDSFEIISNKNLNFLYFDGSHLTKQGSKELGSRLKSQYPYLFDINSLK